MKTRKVQKWTFFSYTVLGDKMLKKKLIQVSIVLLLVLFSFYYTNKTIDIIRETDPLMKQIKEESKKYEIKPENAKIEENNITPGMNGTVVDYEETYKKMKQYGTYNESLTVFKEVTPTVSIEDTYDKFIESGNEEKAKYEQKYLESSIVFNQEECMKKMENMLFEVASGKRQEETEERNKTDEKN